MIENNEIIQIINKLKKFTNNPNEYHINEGMRKSIRGKKYYSLYEINHILRQSCVIDENNNSLILYKKNELIEIFNKAIKNYAIKTIITTLKNIAWANIDTFENIEKRILLHIRPYGERYNNIEELLNELYKKEKNVEYVFGFIDRHIHWTETIEGHEYWRKINATIKKEYYDAIIPKPLQIIDKNVLFEIMHKQ